MRIGIWGDSITHGHNDREMGGWATRLKVAFWNHPTLVASVYTFGVSGDTSIDVLRRIRGEFDSCEPEIVLLAIGVNDSIYFEDGRVVLKEDAFQDTIHEILKKVPIPNHNIFIVGITDIVESKLQPFPLSTTGRCYSVERTQRFDGILQECANELDTHFISMRGVVPLQELDDGLHPDACGHARMHKVIESNLLQKLPNNLSDTS